jgi:hypothetical protein
LIDAARQPRGNDESGLAEIARQGACEFEAGAGGVARTDGRISTSKAPRTPSKGGASSSTASRGG